MIRPGWDTPIRDQVMWRLERARSLDTPRRLSADREACRRDFRHWVDSWGWVAAPKSSEARDHPFILWPRQVELARWVIDLADEGDGDALAVVPKGRELGITWTVQHLVYWLCWTRPGFSVLEISRGLPQVDQLGDLDSLIERLRYIWRHQPAHLRPGLHAPHKRFMLDNGSYVTGESTAVGAGQGGRRSLVVVDEAARIRHLQQVLLSTASVGPRLMVWNPGDVGHPTHRMHMSPDPRERLPDRRIMAMDWRADPRRDQAWFESRLIENGGTMTRAERGSAYELQYGYVSSALIWETPGRESEWIIDPASDRGRSLLARLPSLPLVIGLDYGPGKSLTAGMALVWDPGEGGPYGTTYLVHDPAWARRKASEAARELRSWTHGHRGTVQVVGDPTGEAPDPEQLSWAARFRAEGVPVETLPAQANKMESREWAIRSVQARLDGGRMYVLSTCRYGIEVVTTWRRDLPPGVSVVDSGRGYVPPAKDRPSHGGDALLYAEQRIAQLAQARAAGRDRPETEYLPVLDAADIAWGGTPWGAAA